MRKLICLSLLLASVWGLAFFSCKEARSSREKKIAQQLLARIDSFAAAKNRLLQAVEKGDAGEQQLQQLFLQTRLAYKRIEWAAEYFSPLEARRINGPPVQEVESSGMVIDPAGLQVIEGYLFPVYDTTAKAALVQQLKQLQSGCDKCSSYFTHIDILDWQVFDAAKQEIFRIITLGITGFDNPLSLKSMPESAAALEGISEALQQYHSITDGHADQVMKAITAASDYLSQHMDFNSFDRAVFITRYGNPVSAGITDWETKLGIHITRYNRLLNQDARTLFDTNAFNVNAYAPDPASFMTSEKVVLGKQLFSDPVLSKNGIRSCQSCHQPERAFTDGLVKNTSLSSKQLLRRNTPTLLNAALQPAQFYDLRAKTLEDQVSDVVRNKDELHGSINKAAGRLWQNAVYRRLFSAAFPMPDRKGIDTSEIINAIGSYIRSLTSLNSRFDDYMRGKATAMDAGEIAGFNLFTGKAKCATCHYMPLFNGNFPPRYVRMETEVIGVPSARTSMVIDSDEGRFSIVKVASLHHSFKTITVRDAARTAPYMHNGIFHTLDEVIDFYDKGGGSGSGISINNQTLPAGQLHLTSTEKQQLVSFIQCLNSRPVL